MPISRYADPPKRHNDSLYETIHMGVSLLESGKRQRIRQTANGSPKLHLHLPVCFFSCTYRFLPSRPAQANQHILTRNNTSPSNCPTGYRRAQSSWTTPTNTHDQSPARRPSPHRTTKHWPLVSLLVFALLPDTSRYYLLQVSSVPVCFTFNTNVMNRKAKAP